MQGVPCCARAREVRAAALVPVACSGALSNMHHNVRASCRHAAAACCARCHSTTFLYGSDPPKMSSAEPTVMSTLPRPASRTNSRSSSVVAPPAYVCDRDGPRRSIHSQPCCQLLQSARGPFQWSRCSPQGWARAPRVARPVPDRCPASCPPRRPREPGTRRSGRRGEPGTPATDCKQRWRAMEPGYGHKKYALVTLYSSQ